MMENIGEGNTLCGKGFIACDADFVLVNTMVHCMYLMEDTIPESRLQEFKDLSSWFGLSIQVTRSQKDL